MGPRKKKKDKEVVVSHGGQAFVFSLIEKF